MNTRAQAARRWCVVAFVVAMPLLGGCAGPVQVAEARRTENSLRRFRGAAQDAIECRAAIARNRRYRVLNQRMPSADIGTATLSQMANPKLATTGEITALDAWLSDLNGCRDRLVEVTDATFPSFRPILEASWNDDDIVFVKLATHKIRWGEAILSLKGNATKLRANVVLRANQVAAELAKLEQAQISRRTAIIGSAIGKLP